MPPDEEFQFLFFPILPAVSRHCCSTHLQNHYNRQEVLVGKKPSNACIIRKTANIQLPDVGNNPCNPDMQRHQNIHKLYVRM